MAHNIQKRDAQFGIKQAWHNLTHIVEVLKCEEVYPYAIKPEPLFYRNSAGEMIQHNGWVTPVCSDDGEPIGNGQPVNLETYSLRTPQEDWSLLAEALSGTKHRIVSAGTVANRGKFFITMELDELKPLNAGNREFGQFLNVIGSMDKSVPEQISQSSICTVCENTLQMNLVADVEFKFRFRHSKNMADKMEAFKPVLDQAFGVAKIFQATLAKLADRKCDNAKAERIYAGFVTPVTDETMSTRAHNVVTELTELQQGGLGNRGETMLDTLSGFTQHRTRGVDVENPWKQYVSSEFGCYARQKVEFATLLGDTNRLREVEKRGNELVKAASN